MDWSKLENIIFVGVSAAIALFLLITLFFVMSKGKRKTGALDIVIRIVAILTLVVSAVLFVAAVFAELDGEYRIVISADDVPSGGILTATLVLGEKLIDLPMPALFATLASATGHEIVILLFALALISLVADFMLAKRKYGKSDKSNKKSKTDHADAKRAAEIEKIKRLGDAAVKKTKAAASAQTAQTASAPQPSADEEPDWLKAASGDGDWRTSDNSGSSDFVGLSGLDGKDPDFDTFDDAPTNGDDSSAETPWYENAGSGETSEPDISDVPTDRSEDTDTDDVSDAPSGEFDDSFDAEPDEADENEEAEEPDEYFDAPADEIAEPDEAEGPDAAEAQTDEAFDDDLAEPSDARNDVYYEERETGEAPPEPDREVSDGVIEPDRDIYIPKMRTIDRTNSAAKSAPERQKTAGAGKKQPTGKKAQSAQKARKGGKKPRDPKALPVTRRYVILDRTSAVNIFSDYLKDRDKADKDKLESSISTIIIK